jgi:poly-beta-1,6-N-acetyl-D-glucosamine synthase
LFLYFLLISFLLTLFYVTIMWAYKNEWEAIEETKVSETEPSVMVSVIIPARNEAANIFSLLHDISEQTYPAEQFEVIVIDDHSEDETFAICSKFCEQYSHYSVYKLQDIQPQTNQSDAYKKRAIECAVHLAKGKLIITTDADCRVQKNWIRNIAAYYETEQCKLIAAPVCFYDLKTAFQRFQALDFCGMQAITGASLNMEMFNMANGANLAYEKEAFLAVNGYADIDKKASGDDMLLVYKIAGAFPEKVRFLKQKETVVYTRPSATVKEFLQQRFRWTSKSASYQDRRITMILALVYLFVLSIWLNLFYFTGKIIYSSIFPDKTLSGLINFLPAIFIFLLLIFQLICKSLIDYFFLKSASAFFRRQDLMKSFFIAELLHIWYIPFVGTLGNIMSFTWKGRKLK